MKRLVLALFILPLFASAEGAMIFGSFGTDGASGDSFPFENSVANAAEIYKSLNETTAANEYGDIVIQVGELDFFKCAEPDQGVHSLTAKCDFVTAGTVTKEAESSTAVLGAELSEMLFSALPDRTETVRIGATMRAAANLQCSKSLVTHGEVKYVCEVFETDVYEVGAF